MVSLSNSAPEGKLTMGSVKASLLNEVARRKEMGFTNKSEVNVAQDDSRGRTKIDLFITETSLGEIKVICHYCNKPDHFQKYCRKMKRDKSKDRKEKGESSEQPAEEKNTSALVTGDDDLLFIGDQGYLNLACYDCTWVIDSGSSYHLTSHREYFSER